MKKGKPQDLALHEIRSHFDAVLNRHILYLTNTKEDDTTLSFGLLTIACLYLAVEREIEIESFPESPPNRYTREAFLIDLEEIGIDPDDDVMLAIQELTQHSMITINSKGQYSATNSARSLIETLETIFPKMPGMSLIGFATQSIYEVSNESKGLKTAIQNFDQTLSNQGIPISKAPGIGLTSLSVAQISAQKAIKEDPAVLAARRAEHLKKLTALREKIRLQSDEPVIVGTQNYLKKAEIKELFPKAAPSDPKKSDTDISEPISPEPDPLPITDSDASPIAEPENAPEIETESEPSLSPIEVNAAILDDHAAEAAAAIPAGPDDPEESGAAETSEPLAIESSLSVPESQNESMLTKEEMIEQQIRSFETELAMSCPVCQAGKILSDETEKGKIYYYCSNDECKLISWGKPYHKACPICKNPFLVEFMNRDGIPGLKCPRATCQYRQQIPTGATANESAPNEAAPSKGKRLVAIRKKSGKKGVRRVVRRRKKS